MATYAIGDVQGCFSVLERLLQRIGYDDSRDRIILVGDLVNRGPQSADVLRWAMRNETRVVAVLGNHDLHLLARALGVGTAKKRDRLDDVLAAPDREDLVRWLRARPFVHRENGYLVVHAGLLPCWTADDALRLGDEASRELRSGAAERVLASLSARPGRRWDESLRGTERFRVIVQGLTQLRTCARDATPCLDFDGPPGDAPPGCRPWYDWPHRAERQATVVFGHWSALGLYVAPHAIGLDTGAAWGRELSALRLEDRAIFREPA